jgi:hypothetical protein
MRRAKLAILGLLLAAPLLAWAAAPALTDFSGIDVSAAANAAIKSSGSASSNGGVPAGIVEQVSATMLPSIPQPGDLVQIRVVSYTTDLNKAAIVWTENGQVVAEGAGLLTHSFVAPKAGQKTVVVMTAAKQGGGTVSKKFTVAPAELDLVYEAETYAPPFYRGRTDFTNSSVVRVAALPNFVNPDTGAAISPDDLVYTWRVGGLVDQSISGYGRSTVDIAGKLVSRGLDIEVEAEAVNSPLHARRTLFIQDSAPDVAIYEDHPLYGVLFERATDRGAAYPVGSTEVSLHAVPYSMDAVSLEDSRLKWSWYTDAGKGPAAADVTFRPQPGATGQAEANVRVNHANFAQLGEADVVLDFGDVGALPSVGSTTPAGSYSL